MSEGRTFLSDLRTGYQNNVERGRYAGVDGVIISL
jgi:hypothetical protein